METGLWRSFASKGKESNGQCPESRSAVKKEITLFVFEKGAVIVYFHDVETDQVQRRKVRIRARRGGLEEQCLRVGGEDGTRWPAAGRCSQACALPAQ